MSENLEFTWQGKEGICTSIGVVSSVESRIKLYQQRYGGHILNDNDHLSFRQMVDTFDQPDVGVKEALNFMKHHGVMTTANYEAGNKDGCHHTIRDYNIFYPTLNIQRVIQDLTAFGPLVGWLEARMDFLTYKDGIYLGEDNFVPPQQINYTSWEEIQIDPTYTHTITIVGYGCQNGLWYYIIQNSYGEEWGDNEFGKVAANAMAEIFSIQL